MEEGVRWKEIPMWRFVGLVGRFGDVRSKPGRSQTPSGDASRRPSPNSVEEAQLLYDWADVGAPVVIQW